MELDFWATTDVGRVRDHNEDNFLVDKRMRLFVVADGMGGHAAGEVASAMSVKIVREVVAGASDVLENLEENPDDVQARRKILGVLETAISEACKRVWSQAQEDSTKQGMGTTTTVLLLTEGRGFIGHVGDSRIYMLRQGEVHQLTEDHSLVNEMLRLGKIQPGEEHKIPHKNAVTRAVGVNEFVEVDTFEFDVLSGDQFLVCSDGLCGYFDDSSDGGEIRELMQGDDVREVTEQTIKFANDGGGKDNITSIVVRVTGDVEGRKQKMEAVMQALQATPFFQYLSYKEMVQVVNMTQRQQFEEGAEICSESEEADALYLIVEGRVRLEENGQRLAELEAPDHFGETAIIDEEARRFSAYALTNTRVLSIRRARFMELLRIDSDLSVKLLWNFLQTFTIRLRDVGQTKLAIDASEVLDEDQTSERLMSPVSVVEDDADLEATIDLDGFEAQKLKEQALALKAENKHTATVDELEEDLRATISMDAADRTETLPTVEANPTAFGKAIEGDATIPPAGLEEPSSDDEAEKSDAISGESITKGTAPKAQVLKRSKLILGNPKVQNVEERTMESESLKARLAALNSESQADEGDS